MIRLIYFLTIIFVLIFTAIANSDTGTEKVPEKIIGANDLVFVNKEKTNIPFKYRTIVESIGLMDVGCTVTYIGNGYAITAGHCIWTKFFVKMPESPFIDLPCTDDFDHQFEIWWGYRGKVGDKPTNIGFCERIVYAQVTRHYDFAILKVSNPPKVKATLDLNKPAAIGDSVTVFSHADSQPLQWSKSCSVKRIYTPVNAPPNEQISIKSIMHVCDTSPGSSGAAIIDMQSLKIVGLHNGGIYFDEFKEPPPFDLFDPEAEKLGINYGTYITDSPLKEILKKLGF